MAHQKKKEREVDVKWGRGALMVIGVLQLLVAVYYYQKFGDIEIILVDGAIGGGFIGLSFYAKKNPVSALTIGLIAYIGIHILGIILAGTNPLSGILIKIIVISIIVSAIKAAKKMPQPKKVNEDLIDDLDDSI